MSSRYGLGIRAATPADAPGVAELLAGAGQMTGAAALANRLEVLTRAQGTVLLALEWGPPSGIIVLNWIPTLAADGPVAVIGTLFVGIEDRRRGIGRMLLKAGAQAARSAGCGDLMLLQGPDQPGLRDFALANGFAESGTSLVRGLRKRS